MATAPRYVIPKSLERFTVPDETGYPLLMNPTQVAQYIGMRSGSRGLAVIAAQYDDWPPVVFESDGGRCKFYLRTHVDQWRELHPQRRPDDKAPDGPPA